MYRCAWKDEVEEVETATDIASWTRNAVSNGDFSCRTIDLTGAVREMVTSGRSFSRQVNG